AHSRALDLWRQIGDRQREGDTLRLLGLSLCALNRGEEGIPAIQASVELLEPLGPTPGLAWAYASLANKWMVRGRTEEAITLARRAQAIAGPLGPTELVSDALDTEAGTVHPSG